MSIRKINFSTDEYYHLYNRGNGKRIIFKDDKDRKYFLRLLLLCNSSDHINVRDTPKEFIPTQPLVAIGAFCLMSNHFHLLTKEINEGGVSKFMQKLGTAYSMYFNNKYDSSGGLFEGKFKAQHIDSDRYLRYIFAYIHLNPVKMIDLEWKKNGIKNMDRTFQFLKKYRYSSYLFYEEVTHESLVQNILSPKVFPRYFESALDHREELISWLSFTEPLGKA